MDTHFHTDLLAVADILDTLELTASREGRPYEWSPAQTVRDAIRALDRALDDTALIDWIAAHWESQRSDKQTLLGGRAIENPTGSFRDALRADIQEHDMGAT